MINTFEVNLPQSVLDDLKWRISHTRWPSDIIDSGWNLGTNLSYMKELADYWVNQFDWRKIEKEVNAYPNFMADIEDCKIHFLHIKGKGKKSVPVIISHGWPGSFIEMMKLIPLLTEDPDFSFDLVIPSVIGFGFSEKVNEPGCDSAFIARLWHQLMAELGYTKYGAQGGDIGAGISTWMALQHPESILGLHLNYIPGSYQPYIKVGEALSDEVLAFQQYAHEWSVNEGAYEHQQSSKPLTLSYALNDSPVGLCSWIIEKFHRWSDHQGNLEQIFTKDELLANVTLYWVTQTIYSSVRIYYENSKRALKFRENDFVKVPVAFASFPKELPTPPRSYIEKGLHIRRWTEMPAGGHFAAMEQPQLLATDLKAFFKDISSNII